MNESKNNTVDFSVGDIFYTQAENKYNLYKLLMIEDDFECYHVLSYTPLECLPSIDNIEKLPVFIYHLPMDKNAFTKPTFLTNKPVKSTDLTGYHEYLRQTQEPGYNVAVANNYYSSGLQLTDEKKHYAAIESYSKAIDLFPQFFEAIDNRAFCRMDLGLWSEAIEDFKLSLQQNPNSLLAEFSMGECYLNMAEYENAKRQFEIAHKIDPDHQVPKQFLAKVNEVLNRS